MTLMHGSYIPTAKNIHPDVANQLEIDRNLHDLKNHQLSWAREVSLDQRIQLLNETLNNLITHREEWVTLDSEIRHAPSSHWDFLPFFDTCTA